MFLAGVPVHDRDVLTLVRALRNGGFIEEANRLRDGLRSGVVVFGLGLAEREALLVVLGDGHGEFAELRETLLLDIEWFRREDIA